MRKGRRQTLDFVILELLSTCIHSPKHQTAIHADSRELDMIRSYEGIHSYLRNGTALY